MKRNLVASLVAIAAACVFAGCAGMQTASKLNDQKLTTGNGQDVVHINGSNWGFYLLSIPILSGSTEKPGNMVWNKDTVKLEPVVDMDSHIGSMMFPLPFPFLFYFKDVQVSANVIK